MYFKAGTFYILTPHTLARTFAFYLLVIFIWDSNLPRLFQNHLQSLAPFLRPITSALGFCPAPAVLPLRISFPGTWTGTWSWDLNTNLGSAMSKILPWQLHACVHICYLPTYLFRWPHWWTFMPALKHSMVHVPCLTPYHHKRKCNRP